jgi:hypothetical protein
VDASLHVLELHPEDLARLPLGLRTIYRKKTPAAADNEPTKLYCARFDAITQQIAYCHKPISKISAR